MDNYNSLKNDLTTQREKLSNDFFSGNALYEVLRSRQHGK
jgi:hypothetical protein